MWDEAAEVGTGAGGEQHEYDQGRYDTALAGAAHVGHDLFWRERGQLRRRLE